MASFQLSRRQLLRGAVGGAIGGLALPTLEAMLNRHGDAYAATNQPLPKRLGVFFFGNGVRLDRWVPAQAGANWRLSAELAPLENVKSYVNVVSGYRAKAGYGRRGHHDGMAALMSGIPSSSCPIPTPTTRPSSAAPRSTRSPPTASGPAPPSPRCSWRSPSASSPAKAPRSNTSATAAPISRSTRSSAPGPFIAGSSAGSRRRT